MQRWGVLTRNLPFACLVLLVVAGERESLPQARPTASKSGAISFFGMYTRGDTDRSDVTYHNHVNNGFTFGGDYTHYFHWIVTPSVELRGKILPGATIGQRTFTGGLRLEHRWGNFVPYAGFFIGYGRMTFENITRYDPYRHDDSIVYSAGPGLDYDLTSKWSLRADYQFEHWKIGRRNGFVPQSFSVGVLFRVPFKPYQSR